MRFRQIKPLTEADLQRLDELRMSPRSLQRFASSPEAKGIRAGFEAELVFSGLGGMGDDFDSEPDYDYDERAHSISDIMDFFSNDDQGMGLSERGQARLRDSLDEGYYEWADDQMIRDFNNEAVEQIQQWMTDNDEWDWDQMIREAVEEMSLDSDLEEKVLELADITKASERMSFVKEHPDYQEAYDLYGEAHADAENRFDDEADQHYRDQDGVYDSALENFRENWEYPETGDWLNDVGLRWMSDVANEYNLDWPYWTQQDSPSGEYDYGNAEMLAKSLSQAMGVKAKASSGYHGARRDNETWIFEPDSSLDPDESDNMPVEVVSPPMPLEDCLKAIENFFTWAEDNGAYTNSSTGFHMGVSLPYTGGKTDYVKLALFLGDEHVLDEFGRKGNHFCEAAIKKIRQKVGSKHNTDQIAGALELMKNNLIELATRELKIVGMEGFGKYTSINPHLNDKDGGYIEFRSAGGTGYHQDIDKLKNTLLRYAQAMHVASRPDLERNEYYKKLYKLISPEGNKDLELFAKFSAGELSSTELKKQWAERALEKEPEAAGAKKGQWKAYDQDGKPLSGMEFSNYTEEEAWERLAHNFGLSVGNAKGRFTLVDMYKPGHWNLVDEENQEVIDTVEATTMSEAVREFSKRWGDDPRWTGNKLDVVRDVGSEEAQSKPKLSQRGELAKRIKAAPPEQEQMWQVVNKKTGEVYDAAVRGTKSSLGKHLRNFEKEKGIPQGDAVLRLAPHQQRHTPHGVPEWELYDISTNNVINQIVGYDKNDAWDQAVDWLRSIGAEDRSTYKERFAVRPLLLDQNSEVRDIPMDVAQNDTQARSNNGVPMWEIYNTNNDSVVHIFADHTRTSATDSAVAWLRNAGVRDTTGYTVRPNIDTTPGSRSWRDQLAQHVRDAAPRSNFELYQHDTPDTVFHRMPNATADEVMDYINQQEASGMPPGFLRVRQV